jgi:hypothetical protein
MFKDEIERTQTVESRNFVYKEKKGRVYVWSSYFENIALKLFLQHYLIILKGSHVQSFDLSTARFLHLYIDHINFGSVKTTLPPTPLLFSTL